MRFAVNGNRFRVDITLRKLGLPLLGEHRIKAPFVHGSHRFHAHGTGVHATGDIVIFRNGFGKIIVILFFERRIDGA